MSRKKLKKIITPTEHYGDNEKQFPKVTVRQNGVNEVHRSRNIQRSKFNRTARIDTSPPPMPIRFMESHHLPKPTQDICFVIGGGPSLSGFDFSSLVGYDTIAVNKSVEFISNPTYFITTDYTYFEKGNLPIEAIKQKSEYAYFVANMSHEYMSLHEGKLMDTRGIVYEELYKCSGVIESKNVEGFSDKFSDFCNGSNSGHCGIQLALLLGYKKIYLLGFDLTDGAHTHFHQSYSEIDQRAFRNSVGSYKKILFNSLSSYNGNQEIINLSSQSLLSESSYIKTESLNDILNLNKENANISNATQSLMVVGYYTVDTPYEQEAQNLIQSLTRLGLQKDIVGVKTLGNWQANTRFKAGFMLDMLIKYPNHKLLYVDVDAVMHAPPVLFNNYKCDIAVRWQDFQWRKNECLSGTIYMENNHRTQRLCRLWRDININEGNETSRMEQWNLDTVIQQMKNEDPSFTYKNLPPEYTFIFDIMKGIYPNSKPVIEHFQASRRFKQDVNIK